MYGLMFAADWFRETFGLINEDDYLKSIDFARTEGLIIGDYDSEGRLVCFRGVSVKSPIA
jgi:hypothetical protein